MRLEFVSGSLLELAHQLISKDIEPGDTVVDATIGNGHDTLFLAKCVGETGRVIGFDVQQDALTQTTARLLEEGVSKKVFDLHSNGHQLMMGHVPSNVSSVVFNLGYLPGSDKTNITKTDTTLEALVQAMTCLKTGGILSVMCYPGHAGGDEEANAVVDWMSRHDDEFHSIICYKRSEARETSPFLIIAEKSRS